MAPRRSKPRVDNCSYVRQLFQNFLNQNQQKNVSEILPRSILPPVQRFPIGNTNSGSLFRQSVKRNLLKAQQSNAVKEFFDQASNKPHSGRSPPLANQPVQARFRRQGGSDQFVKCQLSPNAPPRGLAQWLNFRQKIANEQKLIEQQNKPGKKAAEYLELSGTFFSGREPMKLPFDAPINNDKTLTSVVSTFVPPATSTPFDGKPICRSPIILDPVELTGNEDHLQPLNDCESFLQSVASTLDEWCASITDIENTSLNRNYRTLKEYCKSHINTTLTANASPTLPVSLAERCSWKEHSLLSNQIYHQCHKQNASPSFCVAVDRERTDVAGSNDTTVVEATMGCDPVSRPIADFDTTYNSFQTLCLPESKKRKPVVSLLTASPPSPIGCLTQLINEEILFDSHSKPKTYLESFRFDFEPSQPSHSFDNIFSFDEAPENDSFCFFPPTFDGSSHTLTDDTLFSSFEKYPQNGDKSSFFELYP